MSKIVVITGANTGIGYEAVKALLETSEAYRIFLGCRSLDKGQAAKDKLLAEVPSTKSTIDLLQVDIASDSSIKSAYATVAKETDHIDVLINNAGHALDQQMSPGNLSRREIWNQNYDINVSGTDVMTYTFVPLLLKSAEPRLLFVTSGLASLSQLSSGFRPGPAPTEKGWPKTKFFSPVAYRSSKTALNMMMLNWHYVLLPDGVKTFAISPGFLATGLGGVGEEFLLKRGAGHPSIGGQLIKRVATGENDADAGKVVDNDGIMTF